MSDKCNLEVGDKVGKRRGDYYFDGEVVAVFRKRDNGPWRVVVENADRILHIFSPEGLYKIP